MTASKQTSTGRARREGFWYDEVSRSIGHTVLNPQTIQRVRATLNDCLGKNASVVIEHGYDLLPFLDPADYPHLHEISDQRAGYNLASLAAKVGSGWSGQHLSLFRQLVLNGFNVSIADAGGRIPAYTALEADRAWMNIDDFKWAFDHGLSPIAHFPDTSNGRSILSLDWQEGRSSELVDFLMVRITQSVLSCAMADRSSRLAMLKDTALDVYAPRLAQLEHEILGNQTTPVVASHKAQFRRI